MVKVYARMLTSPMAALLHMAKFACREILVAYAQIRGPLSVFMSMILIRASWVGLRLD